MPQTKTGLRNLVHQPPQKRQPMLNKQSLRQLPQLRIRTRRPPKRRARQQLKRITTDRTRPSRRDPRQRLPQLPGKQRIPRIRLTRSRQTQRRPPQLQSRIQVLSRTAHRHQPHRSPASIRATIRTTDCMISSRVATVTLHPQRRRIRHRTIVHRNVPTVNANMRLTKRWSPIVTVCNHYLLILIPVVASSRSSSAATAGECATP
jgi:hypothetical protein